MTPLQLQLIRTVHTLNSFLITNLSLYSLWFSDWSLSLLLLSTTDCFSATPHCSGIFLSFYQFWRTVSISPASRVPVLRSSAWCWIPCINSGQRFDSCVRCPETRFNNSLSRNGLFRVATGTCSAKPRPADAHIAAFRRHVTIP
jgi:hypothetical protein